MGMYDTVICDYPLPDCPAWATDWQTKDLTDSLSAYRITRNGRLVIDATSFTGNLYIIAGDRYYTKFVEYRLEFEEGVVKTASKVEANL